VKPEPETTLVLHLRVEGHQWPRTLEKLEDRVLSRYQVKAMKGGRGYEVTMPFKDEQDLERRVEALLQELAHEASLNECFVETQVREKGTHRQW
jgi:hypothetical protein